MRIAIFGMGYVGCVSAACFASLGHDVIGVDINTHKLGLIKKGDSPIIEPGLDELFKKVIDEGKLTVSDNAKDVVKKTDISMVCVGTPSRDNGSLDAQYLMRVVEEIGTAIREIANFHVVAIRSTLLPGIVKNHIIPLLEEMSGKKIGEGFGVLVYPRFGGHI